MSSYSSSTYSYKTPERSVEYKLVHFIKNLLSPLFSYISILAYKVESGKRVESKDINRLADMAKRALANIEELEGENQ